MKTEKNSKEPISRDKIKRQESKKSQSKGNHTFTLQLFYQSYFDILLILLFRIEKT